ncbi:unnamed protein product [Arabidopsis arenosa]|uniref:Replication protein A 70 kDa DNA-binding subunit B/D first OB fold domain-containing protein n=1 Tax=Arabidopsis arenosa TaxID=38785 RepID=A0A8S1ZJC5_ARAAE|nr:unnamed protein product [Arabidopsis arenosa]
MILADKRGSMIEAKINSELISKYNSEFKDGERIVVHHFQLEMVTRDKRTTNHIYRINFLPSTNLNPIPAKDALVYALYEVSFCDVLAYELSRSHLINLIGYVVNIDEIQYSDPNKRSRDNAMTDFKIKDAGNYILSCVANGDSAEHFHEEWRRIRRPWIVCVLQWWDIYKVPGRMVIQSVGRCSRLDLNPNMHEVDEFREMSSGRFVGEPGSFRSGIGYQINVLPRNA